MCQGKKVTFVCSVIKVRGSPFLEDAVLVILLYFMSEKEEEPEYVGNFFFLIPCYLNITQTKKKKKQALFRSLEVDRFFVLFFFFPFSQPPSDAKFKWLQNGEAVAKQTGNTWKPSSDELARGGKFTCVIHNSVSNETAEPVSYTCGEEPGEHHARVPAASSLRCSEAQRMRRGHATS